MVNPVKDRMESRAVIGSAGRLSEVRLAKRLGGKLTPSSGAMHGVKGDFHLKDFLVESKSTTCDSIPLKRQWLCKISKEALNVSKSPALSISFTDSSGSATRAGDWVMIPVSVFEDIFNSES